MANKVIITVRNLNYLIRKRKTRINMGTGKFNSETVENTKH